MFDRVSIPSTAGGQHGKSLQRSPDLFIEGLLLPVAERETTLLMT